MRDRLLRSTSALLQEQFTDSDPAHAWRRKGLASRGYCKSQGTLPQVHQLTCLVLAPNVAASRTTSTRSEALVVPCLACQLAGPHELCSGLSLAQVVLRTGWRSLQSLEVPQPCRRSATKNLGMQGSTSLSGVFKTTWTPSNFARTIN